MPLASAFVADWPAAASDAVAASALFNATVSDSFALAALRAADVLLADADSADAAALVFDAWAAVSLAFAFVSDVFAFPSDKAAGASCSPAFSQ